MKPTIFSLINLFLLVSLLITFANSSDLDQSPPKRRASSGSKLFYTLMVFLKVCFEWVVGFGRRYQRVSADFVYGDFVVYWQILTWAEMVSAKSSNDR